MKKIISFMLITMMLVCLFPANLLAKDLQLSEISTFRSTEIEDMYISSSGTYWMDNSGKYIPMERKNIPFSSESSVQRAVSNSDYPAEMRKAIQAYYEYVCNLGWEDEVVISVFDSTFPLTRANPSETSNGTTTYRGHEMKYRVLYYGDVGTDTVKIYTKATTFDKVKGMYDLGLTLAGWLATDTKAKIAIEGLSAVNTVYGVMKSFNSSLTKVTGSTKDFVELSLNYRYYEKYVEVKTNSLNWQLALMSAKASVSKGTLRVYLYDDSKNTSYDRNFSITPFMVYGKSYDNPWETAYNNMFLAKYEYANVDIGNARFAFGDWT